MRDPTDIECHCECHTEPGIMHVDSCCSYCPYCDRNILDLPWATHVGICRDALKTRDHELFKKVEKWYTGKKLRHG